MALPNLFDSPAWQRVKDDSSLPLRHPPLTVLPCANVQPAEDTICKDPGTMACSACKLVSYCSKECQTAHWKRHKRDCRNIMRSTDWIPNPVTESDGLQRLEKKEGTEGISLWGDRPAVDVINLACNENDLNKNFSLVFAASGDLRHILQSFNGLPADYSGHLNVLVNDFDPTIFCRNIVLLLILGNVPDETVAADMALHFWYSIFMPQEYQFRLQVIITSFVQQLLAMAFPMPLGPRSTLLTFFRTEFLTKYFTHFFWFSKSAKDIQDEYNRVRSAPSWQDYRDGIYAALKPSHRVAFHQYRHSGLVLPFGAKSDHFTSPNHSLFSLQGKWLQTDYADPLDGWDIPTVINTGKAHGAHPEDIYGCLHFFLSKQLRTFAGRLRTFPSSFIVVPVDPRRLPNFVNENGLFEFNTPKKFDRIDVSNTLDTSRVGLHDVLTLWAPLLEDSPHATIIGHFVDWTTLQQEARAPETGEGFMEGLQVTEKGEPENTNEVKKDLSTSIILPTVRKGCILPADIAEMQATPRPSLDDSEVLHENSQSFLQFLQSQGLDDLLMKTGLRLRDKHHIVPHVRGFLF